MTSIALVAALLCAPQGDYHVVVRAGDLARPPTPVLVRTSAAKPVTTAARGVMLHEGAALLGGAEVPVEVQVDRVAGEASTIELSWVQGKLAEGAEHSYALWVTRATGPRPDPWTLEDREPRTLSWHGATVWTQPTRFDADDVESTKKTYQHLFSPDGKVRLTKGPGGLYPHHRGLFAGWNHTTTGDRTLDFWHATGGVTLRDCGVVAEQTTTGAARAVVTCRIDWLDADEQPIVHEQRTLTAWNVGEHRRVLDLAVALTPAGGPVSLRGDPHHAGVQLRLAQECAERNDVTYLRPEDSEPQGNDVWHGGTWLAARATVEDRPFVVVWLTDPNDGRPRIWSTRPYGRFGPFTEMELPEGATRTLRYRLVILDGDGSDEAVADRVHGEVEAWQHPLRVEIEPAVDDR